MADKQVGDGGGHVLPTTNGGHVLPATNGGPPSAVEHDDTWGTAEHQLIMAYVKKRWPHGNERPGGAPSPAPPSVEEPKTQTKTKKKKKKKKGGGGIRKVFLRMLPCVGAPSPCSVPLGDRNAYMANRSMQQPPMWLGLANDEEEEEEEAQVTEGVDELAAMLITLAKVSFRPPEIEADSEEDDITRLAGLFLRSSGDELDEKHNCGQLIRSLLQNYGLFDRLMSAVFHKMGFATPDPGDQRPTDSKESKKTKIAVICEVAGRLSTVDTHPMSRVLGFGARYLKENYSVEEALNEAGERDSEVE